MLAILLIHYNKTRSQEEEKEQLSLNYIAHSDNRLSAQLVLEFLQFILLAHKDPLVTMVSDL